MKNESESFSIILITGNSRSGTTLIAEVLGTSSRVKTLPELHYFENLVEKTEIENGIDEGKKQKVVGSVVKRALLGFFEADQPDTTSQQVSEVEKRVLKEAKSIGDPVTIYETTMKVLAEHFGADSVCDQTGKNIFFLEYIVQMASPVFVIHMVRNPHKVMRSQAGKWRVRQFGVSGIPKREALRAYLNFNPIFEALTIRKIDKLAEKSEGFRNSVFILKYEELTNDTEIALDRLRRFIGEIEFHLDRISVWGSSHAKHGKQQKTGIVKKNLCVPRGKGFRERGGDFWCNLILKKYKEKHNYSGPKPTLADGVCGIGWILIIPIQFFLVVAVNYKRSPHLFAALKRRIFS